MHIKKYKRVCNKMVVPASKASTETSSLIILDSLIL